MMAGLCGRRRNDVVLVHREWLPRGAIRFNRHHEAIGCLDRPEDAPRHRRRTRRVAQELERHGLPLELADILGHVVSPQFSYWITDRKLPAGSLNQAMFGPRFSA